MGARLFTALIPPTPTLESLEEFLEPRWDADPLLRWMSPDSWHVTTCFMGSVGEDHLDRLVENLRGAAGHSSPLTVRLAGGGAFPRAFEARLLYLAVSAAPEGELERLASACRSAANQAGAAPDGTRFVPHLTLVRLRRPAEVTRWLRVLDAAPPLTFEASRLALVESHLHDRANRYEIVEWFPLGEAQSAGYPAPVTDL